MWQHRRRRATACLASAPHAGELLAFYIAVLDEQDRVDRLIGEQGQGPPELWADRAPQWVNHGFAEFIRRLAAVATEPLADEGNELVGATDDLVACLARPWRGAGEGHVPQVDEGRSPVRRFYRVAFLEPFRARARGYSELESAPDRTEPGDSGGATRRCAFCGSPPVVGALRDDDRAKGRRWLICGTCGAYWSYPRATCAVCGETNPEHLVRHSDERQVHMTVCECLSCRSYLKEVDLRIQGTAVPVVDEIATPELDLWARNRELIKPALNLLGL